jgi:uncharacterized metal-binding protein
MKIQDNSKLNSWNSKELWKIQRIQILIIEIQKLNYYNHDFVIFGLGLWTSKSSFCFVDVGSKSIRRFDKDGRKEVKSNGGSMCSSTLTSWEVGIN